ncbi:hypothetical protein ITX31_02685 [Arthrobacter gandavensis]|uniref:hypothetical protein n=1 Tax=Arthrobacter gandavensis TaxID=169960 RepID=UPI00188F7C06|nr:hypothetical protein [Arthrobacter gandavensis]MBF4993018.1 hypothetical protein [Arthrobacter gandavensis]
MGNRFTARAIPGHNFRKYQGVLLGVTALLLAGCSGNATDATQAPDPGPATSAPAVTADPRPTPEPHESAGPLGGPAFEPENAQSADGAPVVLRSDAAANPVLVEPSSFEGAAVYEDGVVATTSNIRRGTVDDEGIGVVAGAEYIVFTVSVRNGSPNTLDLTAVVPTLLYGEDRVSAAPVYRGVEAFDLTGELEPGAVAEAEYAFQLPAGATDPVLYVDLNGSHSPLVFRGDLP